MKLRELSGPDLKQLLELYGHLHESDLPFPPEVVSESIWNSINANPDIKYYGCFLDEELVSVCNIAVIQNLTRGCQPYALIENVVTHRKHRRHGYGREVLKAALGFAWSRHCYKVMLMTGRQDKGTQEFYKSAGFSGEEKKAFIAKK